jgi:serine O-acetyltransferase
MDPEAAAADATGGAPRRAEGGGGPERLRAAHPRFVDAVVADARITAAFRGERHEFRSRADGLVQALRLMVTSDAFLGQSAYRFKARMQALGVPVLPWIAHRLAMVTAQISIGDAAVVHPGVFIPHGQVVVEGVTEIHPGATLAPWVTLGLLGPGVVGPTIGPLATIGTGAKVLGQVRVGKGSRVGANSVVLDDVPDGATAVGMPARTVTD